MFCFVLSCLFFGWLVDWFVRSFVRSFVCLFVCLSVCCLFVVGLFVVLFCPRRLVSCVFLLVFLCFFVVDGPIQLFVCGFAFVVMGALCFFGGGSESIAEPSQGSSQLWAERFPVAKGWAFSIEVTWAFIADSPSASGTEGPTRRTATPRHKQLGYSSCR